MQRRMRSIASPTTAELQGIADRIASRFDYSQPISKALLVQVSREASAELGLECEARVETVVGKGTTLRIKVKQQHRPSVVPVTVVAVPPR